MKNIIKICDCPIRCVFRSALQKILQNGGRSSRRTFQEKICRNYQWRLAGYSR